MKGLSDKETREIARLFEITTDAVLVCRMDGTIDHANQQLLALVAEDRKQLVGQDVKDMLYSESFERSDDHTLPFALDGTPTNLMLKLADGSFIPVVARASSMSSKRFGFGAKGGTRALVALKNVEESQARERQMQRVMAELEGANRRLLGTIDVIMSAVRAGDLPTLIDIVLNKLVSTLGAKGAMVYFSESGGFKLRGISEGLRKSYVPEFIPFGSGIPTYVLRKGEGCRISIVEHPLPGSSTERAFLDLDARKGSALRPQNVPPFKAELAVPVYFGTQVLGIIELGWERPLTPREADLGVLELVCDYLSIQLVGMLGAFRAERTGELTRSLSRLRESFFSAGETGGETLGSAINEICRVLACSYYPVVLDAKRGRYVVDTPLGTQIDLPDDPEHLFFTSGAPAARLKTPLDYVNMPGGILGSDVEELKVVRLTRVDDTSRFGTWLNTHGLSCQGVFFDFGFPAGAGSPEQGIPDGEGIIPAAELALGLSRRFLLLRDAGQEPIDDMEYDYLLRLAHDFEMIAQGEERQREDRHIAQTLQAGMKSALGAVPGITSDSLYSSATRSALVGGDFYTLIRLPDDQAVMILGDVSGKGIEAASMSALVKTALSAYAWEGSTPVHMARSLNSMLMGFSRVETFVTAFIAKLDLRHGRATYCSAGHPPTMLAHTGSSGAPEVEMLSRQSGVMGAFEGMGYEQGSFSFSAGDMLFMYTDGAIEARSPEGAFFGEERLRNSLLAHAPAGVEGLCAGILDELDAFTESALDDDIAMVALRFDGQA